MSYGLNLNIPGGAQPQPAAEPTDRRESGQRLSLGAADLEKVQQIFEYLNTIPRDNSCASLKELGKRIAVHPVTGVIIGVFAVSAWGTNIASNIVSLIADSTCPCPFQNDSLIIAIAAASLAGASIALWNFRSSRVSKIKRENKENNLITKFIIALQLYKQKKTQKELRECVAQYDALSTKGKEKLAPRDAIIVDLLSDLPPSHPCVNQMERLGVLAGELNSQSSADTPTQSATSSQTRVPDEPLLNLVADGEGEQHHYSRGHQEEREEREPPPNAGQKVFLGEWFLLQQQLGITFNYVPTPAGIVDTKKRIIPPELFMAEFLPREPEPDELEVIVQSD